MQLLESPAFRKIVKRLHRNQKEDLYEALRAIDGNPSLGEQKLGDLAWLRVYKFRMVNQPVLLGYEIAGGDTLILHTVGSHENFYRDLKARDGKPMVRPETIQQDETPRKGGQWKRRVRIADEFDSLPDDIAAAFGVETITQDVQAFFADDGTADGLMSDELIRERRKEAERERRG